MKKLAIFSLLFAILLSSCTSQRLVSASEAPQEETADTVKKERGGVWLFLAGLLLGVGIGVAVDDGDSHHRHDQNHYPQHEGRWGDGKHTVGR